MAKRTGNYKGQPGHDSYDRPLKARRFGVQVRSSNGWIWIRPSGAPTANPVFAASWPTEADAMEAARSLSAVPSNRTYRFRTLEIRGVHAAGI